MTRAIKSCHWMVALVGVLYLCAGAAGSQNAEMMYSRGLVEFHTQRYEQALLWFDRAVEIDPEDATARYYRAMAREHAGQRPGAIIDLKSALELKPDFYEARLELGSILTEDGRYPEALAELRQIQHVPGMEGRVALLVGIVQLRQDQLVEADKSFRYAAQRDPSLAASSSYYQGIIAYRSDHAQEAREKFSTALRDGPGRGIGREASANLQALQSGGAQRYMIYAEAGLQYDTNVCLLPDGDSTGQGCVSFDSDNMVNDPNDPDDSGSSIGSEKDGRGVLTVGGFFRPWMTDTFQLTIGYEFYQSAHFHLQEFNLQDHRPRIQLTADLGPVMLGLLGQYDYYLLQDNSFLQDFLAVAWAIVPEGDVGRTEVYFRERRRDFKMLSFDVRDALNHAPGFRQVFYLGDPERYLYLGYRYDQEDPDNGTAAFTNIDSSAYGYSGNEASIGLRMMWWIGIPTELSFAYRHERYDSQSSETDPGQPGSRRHDNEYRVRSYVEIPWALFAPNMVFSDNLSFALGHIWNLNNSDQGNFDYDRHIVSATIQMRY